MTSPPKPRIQAQCFARWWPAAIVFFQLIVYSAVQAPVPAVNEPHYLGKAKHLWNHGWAAGDFFLESSNPHLVFYLVVGWLTRYFSLEATAWIARFLVYGLLAIGWTMFARCFAGSRIAAIPSVAIFLLLASIGNLSGEWLVGGVEGKVFAYAFLFAGSTFLVERRRKSAAACFGIAVSFHPVVGAWGLICAAVAELVQVLPWNRPSKPTGHSRRDYVLALVVFFLTALPGLVPAFLSLGGASSTDTARANYIQVFIRLRHHLDPTTFGLENYLAYTVMTIAWLALLAPFHRTARTSARDVDKPRNAPEQVWILAFVVSAVAIALVGVAIGWHSGSAWNMSLRDLRTTLLKFYPFRLADVFVPLALSLVIARTVVERHLKLSEDTPIPLGRRAGDEGNGWALLRSYVPTTRMSFHVTTVVAAAVVAFVVAISIPQPSRNPSRMTSKRFAAWTDAARWVHESTPPDAVVVTPTRQWGFRWFSGRALYVNYKDAPQDTAGLLEWERRLDLVRRWWQASRTGYFTHGDLIRLGEQTDAGYLVTLASPLRFGVEPLYDNGTYRIYPLR